ncbi:MAG: hypothetical protein IPK70_08515 [Flavobacteriales bacterium]|jgi:hypothetical protein|nr:hypothetical protein [Flavobacteriales bacterium]
MELVTLRTALLITLSILLVVVLWQRFRRKVLASDLPAPLHAELRSLEVAYHPQRLFAELHLPEAQLLRTALSDDKHQPLHRWPDESAPSGNRRIERALPDLAAGTYHFELLTATQRTVRRFRLQT